MPTDSDSCSEKLCQAEIKKACEFCLHWSRDIGHMFCHNESVGYIIKIPPLVEPSGLDPTKYL